MRGSRRSSNGSRSAWRRRVRSSWGDTGPDNFVSVGAITMDAMAPLEKRCPRCGLTKPAHAFGRARAALQTYCRPCTRVVWREWYHRQPNRQRYLAQVAERRRRLTARNRRMLQELKSRPCVDCGRSFPYYVMDFDHLEDKVDLVSRMVSCGPERILAEVAKCDLVCANCHRIRTFGRLAARGSTSMRRSDAGLSAQARLPGLG